MLPQIGSPVAFFDDFYNDGYIPQVLDLVLEAWQRMIISNIPVGERHEPRISRLLARHMETILYNRRDQQPRLPLLVESEAQKPDPITGQENSRWDIEIRSNEPRHPDSRSYFVFEAKKLRVATGRPNNGEYMAEMITFLSDTKKVAPAHVGMLGYVMDGDVNQASSDVQAAMSVRGDLNITSVPTVRSCHHLAHPPHGETKHHSATNRQGDLTIYHLLLSVDLSIVE